MEPHKKQLHVTLAYHFQTSHLPTLEKLAQNIDVKLGCDWVAAIFSRDIRFVNHEVHFLEFVSVQKERKKEGLAELQAVPAAFVAQMQVVS